MDKRTILIVEDNWQDRALMTFMLESAGYSVLNALDKAEAIRGYVLHKDSIVLIVLGTASCTRDLLSFAECVLEIRPNMPILSKAGEPLKKVLSSFENTQRLKPLSLMVRTLRAIEGQVNWSQHVRNDFAPQYSLPSATKVR